MRSERQRIAVDGNGSAANSNGFRFFSRLSRPLDVPPVAACAL
jgi:hypothetical protein